MEALIKKRAAELDDRSTPLSSKFQTHRGCGTIKDAKYDAAMRLYGLVGSFSAAQLKHAYKRLALIYHPDKPGGTKETFNKLKSGYKCLRPHATRTTMTLNEMLKERDEAVHIEKVETKDFNRTFESRHTSAHAGTGHDKWFRSEIPTTMRAPEKVKFKQFNEMFDRCNAKKTGTIVKHVIDYMPSSNMACSSIYGDNDTTTFDGEGYSDLKLAYGQSILS
jgi:hypothetical protein